MSKFHLAPKPSQIQMLYAEQRKIGKINEDFMFFVRNGLTKEDLEANIKRNPELWARFEHWLDLLPNSAPNKE